MSMVYGITTVVLLAPERRNCNNDTALKLALSERAHPPEHLKLNLLWPHIQAHVRKPIRPTVFLGYPDPDIHKSVALVQIVITSIL